MNKIKSTVDDKIEKYILSRIRLPSAHSEETMSHFPSGLMACMRSRYYSWMSREDLEKEFGKILNVEPEINKEWMQRQSIFRMGHAVEDELGEWLSYAGLLPSPDRSQFRIRSRKFLISGNIDYLILWDGVDIPIECKSAKKEMFESWGGMFCTNCNEKLRNGATVCKGCQAPYPKTEYKVVREGFDTKPSIEHYAQIQSYLFVGGFPFGYLFYYNKNSSETRWHRIERDDEFWAKIVAQNEELMEFVKTQKIPERCHHAEFDLNGEMRESSDWQCKFCDNSRYCWHDVIQEHLTEREKEIARLFGAVK